MITPPAKFKPKSLSPIRVFERILQSYSAWRIGATPAESASYNVSPRVLLTFDDFGEEANVRGILEVLRTERIRAVFFIVGTWAREQPELMRLFESEGHWVGNHTDSHANLKQLSDDAIRAEILGGPRAQLLRPPYGAYDRRIRRIAAELGYKIGFWTVDTKDWTGLDAAKIQARAAGSIAPGGCILMHLNAPSTLEALPGLIAAIRERGMEFCNEGNEIVL